MSDIFTKSQRSKIMAKVRSTHNLSTELALKKVLKAKKIVGWRSNISSVFGKPDLIFRGRKIALFVDGCFWHGCRQCKRNLSPSSNVSFWEKKIKRNRLRDKIVSKSLILSGWNVLRIWEHDVQKPSPSWLRKLKILVQSDLPPKSGHLQLEYSAV